MFQSATADAGCRQGGKFFSVPGIILVTVSWFERITAFLCLCIVAASPAGAHPHVWVTARTEVVFDVHEAITGFRQQWTFDEGYSRFAVEGIDANHDGAYDRDELKELAEVNIISLKEFDYFTFPRLAGRLLQRLPPKDYWLEYHDGKLTLFFTLPLAQALPIVKVKSFTLRIYDATYYVDFGFAKERPITLAGAPGRCVSNVKPPAAQTSGQSLLDSDQSTDDPAAQYTSVVTIRCPPS
jgi:ABC-type uncharacterized transport system substrate-binding protein